MSIYGDKFYTPESREPYFIKIQRCVTTIGNWKQFLNSDIDSDECWSVPAKNGSVRKEIEIVVPDINNGTKFYKYVVYNDTACECGTEQDVKQHKNDLPQESMY